MKKFRFGPCDIVEIKSWDKQGDSHLGYALINMFDYQTNKGQFEYFDSYQEARDKYVQYANAQAYVIESYKRKKEDDK